MGESTVQIGLALSGGGARALAHIGVLKVLEEVQVPVHMLAGTSMGGIVAAVYAAGRSAAEIEQLARSLRLLDIVQRGRSGLGLMGQGKIASRLREALGGDPTFDQLKLPLALTAVDLETGEEVVIREGSVVEGLLATTAVPVVFPPVAWRDRLLVDGGVLNQVPCDVVRGMGAEADGHVRVIAVHTLLDLSGRPEAGTPLGGRWAEAVMRLLLRRSPWASLFDVTERSLSIMIREMVKLRTQDDPPDVMIEIPLGHMGPFDLAQVAMCIQAGEEAARQHMPELIGLREVSPLYRLTHWRRSVVGKVTGRDV
jgi:NTE family protein